MLSSKIKTALAHVQSDMNSKLYKSFGWDRSKPTRIFIAITDRCNARCISCPFWQNKIEDEELTTDQWKEALSSIKSFSPDCHIQFSGGEPLLRKDIVELFAYCNDLGLRTGLVSNGWLLAKDRILNGLVDAQLRNINLSLDSHKADVHDFLRGRKGFFDRITEAVPKLRARIDEKRAKTSIFLKPTVSRHNAGDLVTIMNYALELGADAVQFQPISAWTDECKKELWVRDLDALESSVGALVKAKKDGAPILNSEWSLNSMINHFMEKPMDGERRQCTIGLTNMEVRYNGECFFCHTFPSIGSFADSTLNEIWTSEHTRTIRKKTFNCKKLCLSTCRATMTLREKLIWFMRLKQ